MCVCVCVSVCSTMEKKSHTLFMRHEIDSDRFFGLVLFCLKQMI